MSKIGLIIKREYKTRVRKRSFIILSIITPMLISLLIMMPVIIQKSTFKKSTILIVDNTVTMGELLERTKNSQFIRYVNMPPEMSIEEVADKFENSEDTMVLHLNKNFGIISNSPGQLYNNKHPGPAVINNIQDDCFDLFRKIQVLRLTKLNLAQVDQKLGKTCRIQYEGLGINPQVRSYLSLTGGMFMYLLVLIYGVQVMKGIMEEKNNRIIEIILSSIKPVKLMWGKIIGIGLVGITQFTIIIITSIIFLAVIKNVVDIDASEVVNHQIQTMDANGNINKNVIPKISIEELDAIRSIEDLKNYLPTFLLVMPFLFVGGYLLYASFFAAVGSASNPDTETQQFILPITIPIIISVFIATTIMNNPGSDLALYSSMFPLTSPVVMAARLPYINWATEWWQIVTAIVLLFGTVLFSTRFAARVYRTAILLYGQKLSYKNIWKWYKQSN
jgi:ABC-2 type transport system permease protein